MPKNFQSLLLFTITRIAETIAIARCHVYSQLVSKANITLALTASPNPNLTLSLTFPVPVSVEAKLSFVEPGRRWAHSPSPSKASGISYQGTMKASLRMLNTSGGL